MYNIKISGFFILYIIKRYIELRLDKSSLGKSNLGKSSLGKYINNENY